MATVWRFVSQEARAMTRGLLLFAHGARDPRWALPFEDVARRIRALRPGLALELAYLEFMRPDVLEAGRRLAAAGCRSVDVLPLFLGAGGHVRKDLPAWLLRLGAEHPVVQWHLRPAIGEADVVIAAMAAEALRLLDATLHLE
jgi:sirohydrochlorin cobaltochelatase